MVCPRHLPSRPVEAIIAEPAADHCRISWQLDDPQAGSGRSDLRQVRLQISSITSRHHMYNQPQRQQRFGGQPVCTQIRNTPKAALLLSSFLGSISPNTLSEAATNAADFTHSQHSCCFLSTNFVGDLQVIMTVTGTAVVYNQSVLHVPPQRTTICT